MGRGDRSRLDDLAANLAALAESDEEMDAAPAPTKKDKKKKKKKGAPVLDDDDDDVEDLTWNPDDDGAGAADDLDDEEDLGYVAPVPNTEVKVLSKAEKKAAKKAAEKAKKEAKKKKKKGKKEEKAEEDEEDIDALLNDLEMTPAAETPAAAAAGAGADAAGDDGEGEGKQETLEDLEKLQAEGKTLTKAQKRKLKKLKAKAGDTGDSTADKPAGDDDTLDLSGSKKKGKKKVNAKVAAIKAQVDAMREAEEKARREAEEAAAKAAEEERIQKEKEEKEAEARRIKKEKQKAKLAEKKAAGLVKTKKQREAERKAAAYRAQLEAQGLAPPVLKEGESADQPKKKSKVVYGKKKKKPNQQQKQPEPQPEPEPEPEPEKPKEEEKKAESDDDLEDWEKVDEEAESKVEKDDWEESEDEEEVKKPAKPAAAPAKKAPKLTKKQQLEQAKAKARAEKEAKLAAARAKKEARGAGAGDDDSDYSYSDDSSYYSSSYESSDDGAPKRTSRQDKAAAEAKARIAASRKRREERRKLAQENASSDNLRSPICCILGHVDTGKTKLLDKIRHTNVQDGEAGGITQQIGATFFPIDNIKSATENVKAAHNFDYNLPGLLVIDTPGHESFTNLRSRGSSLCDIAILVVDIMHGLEPQTRESIGLLKRRKTPFVVALNKVDRLYGWVADPNKSVKEQLDMQSDDVKQEFQTRLEDTMKQFAEEGLNACAYYDNPDPRKYVSLIPTSAHSGDGVADLLMLIVGLTQQMMSGKLAFVSELNCTVLEVKTIEGLGTTVDVILVNGILHEGDTIVLCGLNGPIVTQVRALLTPQPMKELRVKGQYVHHKEVVASLGIKIAAHNMEKVIAGSQLLVAHPEDDIEDLKLEVMSDLDNLMKNITKQDRGVYVMASTLGSLEALLEFLRASKIPVFGIQIGPVHKKDVIRASVMLDKKIEYGTILAFDVPITKDAQAAADDLGVKIFRADIIYHLFDQFTNYVAEIRKQRQADAADKVVFPAIIKPIPHFIFNVKDPIIMGVDVLEGVLKLGTPMCVVKNDVVVELGQIDSIEIDNKAMDTAKAGQQVAVSIVTKSYQPNKMYGRHFTGKDQLISRITRASLDLLKENFKDELTMDEWKVAAKIKKILKIGQVEGPPPEMMQ
eukprot:TRINITY_DN127_c1_g4_i1.p1 TRINITY_DN127_c1_g4~~TRINITY_DN127_c1_g4_i1.p1  ORF type:complete len:1142 (+),score=539.41 TRINITY_DN127_c1_g4_i1:364-3789(+)